jgi:midasin (ATPase involved in ribosome maturation)
MKIKLNMDELYFGAQSPARLELSKMNENVMSSNAMSSIAPTKSLLRLMNLILRSIQQREPVLLVGGKSAFFCPF